MGVINVTPLEFLKLRNQGDCSKLLRILREANKRNKELRIADER